MSSGHQGGRKEAQGGKSWKRDSAPNTSVSQPLFYPFQGSALKVIVLVVPRYCVLYPTILGQSGLTVDLKNTW